MGDWKSNIKDYLKYRANILFLYVGFSGIVLFVNRLYGDWTEGTIYGLVLCGLVLFLLGIYDFLRFLRAQKERRLLSKKLGSRDVPIPEKGNPVEQEYLEMLKEISDRYCHKNEQWIQSKRERQEYYTTWVHQIKTPISAMNMTLQNMDTQESRQLQTQVFRIEEYVEMVLHFARLEEDGNDFVFGYYDVDEMLRKSIRKYAPLFVQKKIALHYEPIHREILTDEKWFGFIVEQILSNAIKYTRQGAVTIAMEEPGVLTIADTGIGIAAEDVPRVFEKGYTGYNGRDEHKSTGLGLYLCKRTADKLNHELTLRSVVGQGTTVEIKVPSYKNVT